MLLATASPTFHRPGVSPPGHTGLMSKRLKVPEPLHEYPTLYKLVWLYVEGADGEELRVEDMAHDLGLMFPNVTTALRYMIDLGSIIELRRRAGTILGIYRVAKGNELKKVKPYETQQERRARKGQARADA